MSLMQCTVASQDGDGVALRIGESTISAVLQVGISVGDTVTLGVRPEHLNMVDTGGVSLEGELEAIERLGDITYLFLLLAGGGRLTVAEQGDRVMQAGDCIRVYAVID